jgi:NADH-quinone oxidoreductase subunit J
MIVAAELRNGQLPLGEAVSFWVLGPISIAGALGTVLFRNAVHSALSLVATMFSLGAFYLIEQGPFLGLVQIIVYTGAIMILFLFVLMLIGRDLSDSLVETLRGQRWAAALFGIGFAVLVGVSIGRAFTGIQPTDLNKPNAGGTNVNSISELLFT